MSPEQAEGRTDALGPATDVYGLGSILYALLTGRPPHQGSSLSEVLNQARRGEVAPPRRLNPRVPAALERVCLKALAADPAGRHASAAALADELRRYLHRGRLLAVAAAVVAVLVGLGAWFLTRPPEATPVPYRGQVDILVERGNRLLRLNEAGALPLHKNDKFRVKGQIDPAAYVYVVWVDPGHDVTPVYPWDPEKGWGTRPVNEERVSRVSLPPNARERYTAEDAKPGVATMVLFARPTPLDVPDEVLRQWFEGLPDLALPAGGEKAAVWFDDYVEVRDPDRVRTFGTVGSDDAFARWQGQLQQVLGGKTAFQTAVSFARTGRK
jgi:hypothetical protein